MNKTEKIQGIEDDGVDRKIVVTHVTIRQSIFILLLKLIAIEFLSAGALVTYQAFIRLGINYSRIDSFAQWIIPLLIIGVVLKTTLMIFIIFQWLNEYYEITPSEVIHKNGLIFKKEERFAMNHLGSLEIEQSLLGRIFNYGTIKTYNWALERDFPLYLIHNAKKYYHILDSLIPDADKEKSTLREHIIEPDEV